MAFAWRTRTSNDNNFVYKIVAIEPYKAFYGFIYCKIANDSYLHGETLTKLLESVQKYVRNMFLQ